MSTLPPVGNVKISQHFLHQLRDRKCDFPQELFFELIPGITAACRALRPKVVKFRIRQSYLVARAEAGGVLLITVMPIKTKTSDHYLHHGAETELVELREFVDKELWRKIEPPEPREVNPLGIVGLVPAASATRPPKIPRNQPCPCGSGTKYKRCCEPHANR